MKQSGRLLALLALLCVTGGAARGDVLVLVHGWSANADTWIHSGVIPALESQGWGDAGLVTTGPSGVYHQPAPGVSARNRIYRVHLPAEAPLMIQAAHLLAQLQFVRRLHPEENLAVAGHSAGGVVARLVLVRPEAPRVDILVTIATPNLGTSRALQGLDVADSKPFFCPGPGVEFLKNLLGGDSYRYLEYSRGALIDLVPAAPGSLIGWLNLQPHPDIAYHAVVREGPVAAGDELVPAFSQDLNLVPPLRGKARIYRTPASHALNPADGTLLAQILAAS